MTLKKLTPFLSLLMSVSLISRAQQPPPTSGDVTVRLSEPIAFATARPLQAVRSIVVTSTNPAVPAGSLAVLQLQNRDGSYTLKLIRIAAGGSPFKTMSQPGVSVSGGPASGQNASLANGAMVRFTLTQQDGSPGPPVQQASTPPVAAAGTRASASAPTVGTTKDRAHFEIEGVKLGMTLNELLAVAKPYGAPKVSHQGADTSVSFKTKDLEFNCGVKSGSVHSMEIYSVKKIQGANALADLQSAGANSRMYQKAIEVFGRPDDTSEGDVAKWKSADGSTATYSLDGDALEVLAK